MNEAKVTLLLGLGVMGDTPRMGNESILWPELELPRNPPCLPKDSGENSLVVVVNFNCSTHSVSLLAPGYILAGEKREGTIPFTVV